MSAWLVRLYPESWRARYGDEFEALLESRPLTPLETVDVVRGALDARLHARRSGGAPSDHPGALRLGAYTAVWTGLLWPGGLVLQALGEAWWGLGLTAHLFGALALLITIVALSTAQATERQAMVWSAAGLPVVGCLTTLATAAATFLPGTSLRWETWFIGILMSLAGSAIFAIAAFRVGRLSRRGAVMVAGGSAVVLLTSAVAWSGIISELAPVGFVGLLLVGSGWVLIGRSAARLDGSTATAATA